MIKALIVDDEPLARENLCLLLKEYCADVDVVAECKSGDEAMKAMDTYRLDVAFVDIQMPGMSGIELAEKARPYHLHIVFVTAHNEFAVQAFRLSALDYLLKPVVPEQLAEVVQKLNATNIASSPAQLELYKRLTKDSIDRIALPIMTGLEICLLQDIVLLNADESYTEIIMHDKSKKMVSRKIGEMEEMMSPLGFIRIHKSHMVNERHIIAYIKGEGGQVKLSNGLTVDVSRRKKDDLLRRLNRV